MKVSLMKSITPLPEYLINRYKNWKVTGYLDRKAEHERLADEGQHPTAMVISCCDSRVHVTSIFGAETGEFFIHRNIANLVPPFKQDGGYHGTSAVIEYAVTALHVEHIIVLGHSQCGGVRHCHDSCHSGGDTHGTGFVGRWMDILRPGYERVKDVKDDAERIRALEHVGVVIAMENLLSFPFISEAIDKGKVTIHGLWHNIRDGGLWVYDQNTDKFDVIS